MALPHRFFRALVAASLALVMWGLARPAWAGALPAAPLCDDRGATAIAPPPTLQAPDDAILQARAPSCDSGELVLFAAIGPGRSVPSSTAHYAEVFVPTPPLAALPSAGSRFDYSHVEAARCGGTRTRVERPPR